MEPKFEINEEFADDPKINSLDNEEGKESKDRNIDLPTNPEIIASGVAGYEAVYNALPDNLKTFFLNQHSFKTVFLGFTPQSSFGGILASLSTEELEELTKVIESKAPTITFCKATVKNVRDGSDITFTSFVNLKAVENVIKQNSDFFPQEASINTKEWLTNNPFDWWIEETEENEIRKIRYGLLSGFPRNSVLKYGLFWKAIAGLGKASNIEERKFVIGYHGVDFPRTKENTAKLLAILKKENPNITSEEIELIKNARSIPESNTKDGYLGSNGGYDQIFQEESEKLYQQSGIDQLAKRLSDPSQ